MNYITLEEVLKFEDSYKVLVNINILKYLLNNCTLNEYNKKIITEILFNYHFNKKNIKSSIFGPLMHVGDIKTIFAGLKIPNGVFIKAKTIPNYSNEELITSEKSILLVGPAIKNWSNEVLQTLTILGFDGIVYILNTENYEFEKKARKQADVILFWVPGNLMIKLSPIININNFLDEKIIYGRSNKANDIEFLDWLYSNDYNKEPINDLEELTIEAFKATIKRESQYIKQIIR